MASTFDRNRAGPGLVCDLRGAFEAVGCLNRRSPPLRLTSMEAAFFDLDRTHVADLARHMQYRRRKIDVAFRAVKMSGEPATGLDAVELLQLEH